MVILLVSSIHSFGQWTLNRTSNSLFYNQGNVGIGTINPAYRLHLWNGTLGITPDSISRIGMLFSSGGSDFTNFRHILSNGNDVLFEMNLQPRTATAAAAYRFFRQTNTTGRKTVDFFRGNNTTERSAQIGVDGANSYFQGHGGNFGIGDLTPDFKFSVAGHVGENSSLSRLYALSTLKGSTVLTLAMKSENNYLRNPPNFLELIDNDKVVAKIDKYGGAFFDGFLNVSSSANISGKLTVSSPDENANILLKTKTGKSATIGVQDDNNQGFYVMTGDTYRMSITQSGNVGFGTEKPESKLHVDGNITVSSPNDNTNIKLKTKTGKSALIGLQDDNNQGFYVMTDDKYRLSINQNGNIGINTTVADDKLHIKGNLRLEGGTGHTFGMGINDSGDLEFRGDGNQVGMVIGDQFGSVGIGFDLPKIPSGYRLAVGGKIICEELRVQLSKEWPDYVFRKNYQLMPLSEVAKSIEANGHLPGIPSAEEVAKNGLTLGEMQAKMMEKIEELTLHMIELSKKNEALEQELRVIKANHK